MNSKEGAKKQIVFIMTDTQRIDMLGCYGNTDMITPNLDNLAEESVLFQTAYTCQPVCGPARAALFTGTYPHSNGMWSNNQALGNNVKTIGQRLSDSGYHTAYIGKWHLDGGDYFGLGCCPDGWDPEYWYDMRNYLEDLTPEERVLSRKASSIEKYDISEDFCFASRCTDKGIRFLENYTEEDFLLVVSYDEPHGPFISPKKYSEMYKDYKFPKSLNIKDTLEGKPDYQEIWAGDRLHQDKDVLEIREDKYFGCNTFVDVQIGRLVDSIQENCPNAMIIYTSDHGDFMDSHSLNLKGPAVYEEICHIPLMIKFPGSGLEGTRYKNPVSHINIVPTIMEYMGLKQPKMLEGHSLLPLTEDLNTRINQEVFIEFGRYELDHDGFGGFQPLRSVFDGRYKLSVNLLSTDELYDLENDPEEMVNLIDNTETAKIRDNLHDRLLNWMNETRDPFRGYYWHRRPWRKDAPEATWNYTCVTRQRENEEYEPRQLDYDTGLEMVEASRKKSV